MVGVFQAAAELLGLPASLLTDNRAIFNAESRGGRGALVKLLDALGVAYKHSRPYHPQTCGEAERFHQALKRWLAKQLRAQALEQLQAQLDWSRAYYTQVRPHRARGRRTPAEAYGAPGRARVAAASTACAGTASSWPWPSLTTSSTSTTRPGATAPSATSRRTSTNNYTHPNPAPNCRKTWSTKWGQPHFPRSKGFEPPTF